MNRTRRELKGIGVCDNIGAGRAVVIREEKPVYDEKSRLTAEEEKNRFYLAEDAFMLELTHLIDHARKNVGDTEAEILEGQLMMARDTSISKQAVDFIETGLTAERSLENVCKKYIKAFSSSGDSMLKDKAEDIRAILSRMLVLLSGDLNIPVIDIPDGAVVVGWELTPSVITSLYNKKISGIITESGGTSGHAALIARALMIPAVFSVTGVMRLVSNGQDVIVNGSDGLVYINPNDEDRKNYSRQKEKLEARWKLLMKYRDLPTVTADGIVHRVVCNIGSFEEAHTAMSNGSEGIGLFRTEFFFQQSMSEPTEDEQYEMYRRVVLGMKDREVIIRTLDIGGDKPMPFQAMTQRGRAIQEKNPFLGLRGIRQSMVFKDLFINQIKAIMRSAVHGNVSLMIPLVTNIEELRKTKEIIKEAADQLRSEGKKFREDIPVGVMVETPAAALIADDLAQEAAFFSIGSNDLIQYVMCAERGNPGVEYLSSVFEPSVLRCINKVIAAGHEGGIRVGICGEAVLDPRLIPLLVAWGLDDYSVNTGGVAAVRSEIARWTTGAASAVAAPVLKLKSREEIIAHLNKIEFD